MNSTLITSTSDSVRTRRLLAIGILLIVAAAAITASRLIHSRMQQARLMQDRPKDLQWGTYVYSPATAAKAQTQRQKYLAKANLLRDHWRVWALAHQDSLNQLRHAPPNDYATMMRFFKALPMANGLNQTTGITLQDIGISPADVDNSHNILFAWYPAPPAENKDAEAADLHKRQHDFTLYHCLPIAESMTGRSRVTLWADGRLTEVLPGKLHPGERRGEEPEKEIVPPYDFLK